MIWLPGLVVDDVISVVIEPMTFMDLYVSWPRRCECPYHVAELEREYGKQSELHVLRSQV